MEPHGTNTPSPAAAASVHACPGCGATFHAAEPPDRILECPACRTQFFTPAPEDEPGGERDEPPQEHADELPGESRLNANRIKQVSTLRRGLYRTRGYVIAGAAALAVAAADCLWLAAGHVRLVGWGVRSIGYALAAVACVAGVRLLWRRVAAINLELRRLAQARARHAAGLLDPRRGIPAVATTGADAGAGRGRPGHAAPGRSVNKSPAPG